MFDDEKYGIIGVLIGAVIVLMLLGLLANAISATSCPVVTTTTENPNEITVYAYNEVDEVDWPTLLDWPLVLDTVSLDLTTVEDLNNYMNVTLGAGTYVVCFVMGYVTDTGYVKGLFYEVPTSTLLSVSDIWILQFNAI